VAQLTAIYDACVLYPAPLRDFLMQLALTDLFRAKWTNRIHDEWIKNLLKNRPDLKKEQLEKTRRLMNAATRECLVEGYEDLIESVKLPDENDRHVLAAAIQAQANVIVTINLKDFPTKALRPYKVEAIHPDNFILHLLEINSVSVYAAARLHRARLLNPPKSIEEYLLTLSNQGLVKTVEHFKDHSDGVDYRL
jgi:predicted nucleic acid-binding protein